MGLRAVAENGQSLCPWVAQWYWEGLRKRCRGGVGCRRGMRLKQLEVQGFKSFPHRTVVGFAPGLTAIVGPNGCGKSNVVDAIRWVLGEQSPRLLRGTSMDDVLFKGSDQVPPSNVAEVSLTLELAQESSPLQELEEGSLAAEVLRHCAEVKVTRRLYRSGEGEYLMNGRPCRLRDITELFLGSGLGSRSYAIIEQGRVEQLIVAKPEDRRVWIEEAAGTTLFRSRKAAAERKLHRTRENLQRVSDILRELDRQLNYLRRLAKRAEQARATETHIHELESVLACRERDRLSQRIKDKEEELCRCQAALDRAREALAAMEQALHENRARERDAVAALNATRERRVQLEAELGGTNRQIALAEQQCRESDLQRGSVDSELDATCRQLVALAAQRSVEAASRCRVAATIFHLEHSRAQAKKAYQLEQAKLAALRNELNACRNEELELRQRRLELESQVRSASRECSDLTVASSGHGRETREAASQLTSVELELVRHRARLLRLEGQLAQISQLRKAKRETVRALKEELQLRREEYEKLADEVLRMQSRLDTLEELRRRYEGFKPGVQKFMLGENGSKLARAAVADVIQVPASLERAVAAALGELLQCVIVEDSEGTLAAVRRLKDEGLGRGAFIALQARFRNGAKPWDETLSATPLAELVEADDAYRSVVDRLLAHVALVPKLEDALQCQQSLEGDYLLVTPAGETVDQRGVVTGGTEQSPEEEILARRRLIQELTDKLRDGRSELAIRQEVYEERQRAFEEEEALLQRLELEAHDCSLQLLAVHKDIDRLCATRRSLVDRIEHSSLELRRVQERLAEAENRFRLLNAELNTLSGLDGMVQPRRQMLEQLVAAAEKRCRLLDGQVRDLEVKLATQRERHEALVRTLTRLERDETILFERQQSLETAVRDSLKKADEGANLLRDLTAHRKELESSLEELRAEEQNRGRLVDELERERRVAEERLEALSVQVDTYRESKTKVEVEIAELRAQVEHLRQTVEERYACSLEELQARPVEESDEELRTKLKTLRSLLEKVGAVGSGVVEELRETEERAEFLRTQRDDLERSLRDVQSTIERLERVSRAKFLTTLEAVQREFAAVVPRLFGGGEGRIVLTEPDNVANSGVEIVVRPPGKRLEAVGLLSGGEKALAAVGLIFALFAWRPSPFCILDEVDAPLDDANVGRFMELVREMSRNSQFIVITHNKRTMQAADRLYGVTMQYPGVSTLLAVELR